MSVEYAFSGIVVRYCALNDPAVPDSGKEPLGAENVDSAVLPRSNAAKDQLHVNLWEMAETSTLDLGIMIHDWKGISSVQVDLPWAVKPHDISDLGSRLNSEKTVAAIFNEVVHYNGSADLSYAEISFRPNRSASSNSGNSGNHGHFALLRLSSNSYETNQLHSADGTFSTQLRVKIPQNTPEINTPIYLRFRIRKVPPKVYSSVFPQKDRNLLSSSTETRIVDFRINVRRGVPEEILSSDEAIWFPEFRKIHFFLTIERSQICEFESQSFVGCRSLFDEEIWNEYIRANAQKNERLRDSVRNYLGYQWTASSQKEAQGVKDLVVLGRFSRNDSNWLYIARFVILGLVFGTMGSAIWDAFKPTPNYIENLITQWPSILVIVATLTVAGLLMCAPLSRRSR